MVRRASPHGVGASSYRSASSSRGRWAGAARLYATPPRLWRRIHAVGRSPMSSPGDRRQRHRRARSAIGVACAKTGEAAPDSTASGGRTAPRGRWRRGRSAITVRRHACSGRSDDGSRWRAWAEVATRCVLLSPRGFPSTTQQSDVARSERAAVGNSENTARGTPIVNAVTTARKCHPARDMGLVRSSGEPHHYERHLGGGHDGGSDESGEGRRTSRCCDHP